MTKNNYYQIYKVRRMYQQTYQNSRCFKQKILEQQKTGTDIGKKLLEQLDTLEFYVQMEKERKDLGDEIKNITEENEQHFSHH